jgi:hypothetical protein
MKFLIIQKIKQDVPAEKWAKLLPLQFKYFEKLEEEHVLELDYHLVGQQGSMLVVNAETDQKLTDYRTRPNVLSPATRNLPVDNTGDA